jgi:excisionase family DNA binding protein
VPADTLCPPSAPDLTAVEVAAQLGLNPRTVCRHAAEGRIGHSRVGKLLRFTQADVDAYLASCRKPAVGSDPDAYAEHIARLVEAAPPLSDEQRRKLAALLAPAGGGRQ